MKYILALALVLSGLGCGPKQLDVTRSGFKIALPTASIGRLGPIKEQTPAFKDSIGNQKQLAVAFLSDERFVSSSDIEPLSGSSVHVWSTSTQRVWDTGIKEDVVALTASPDGSIVAASVPSTKWTGPHQAHAISFYNAKTWTRIIESTLEPSKSMAFLPDGHRVVASEMNVRWIILDLNNINSAIYPLPRFTKHQTHNPSDNPPFPYDPMLLEKTGILGISSVGFDPYSNMFVFSGLADCEPNKHCDWVIWLDPEHGWDEKLPRTHCDVAPIVTPHGVVWCGKAGSLMFVPFPVEAHDIMFLTGGPGDVQDAVVSKDGCLLATGFEDGTIALFDLSTGQRVKSWSDGHNAPAVDMDFSPSGHHLATVDQDGVLLVWETAQYLPKERAACLPKPPKEAQE